MQTRIDSVMEVVTNTVIGLVISTIANFLLLHLYLGYPMHLGANVLISVVFTVISLVRSYTLRRIFNGRSVWAAIKDKFNASLPTEALVDRRPNLSASGIPLVGRNPDVAAFLNAAGPEFSQYVHQAADGACKQ